MLALAPNINLFRKMLCDKKAELTSNIKRLEDEARTSGELEVLVQVEDALLRIAHKAYGTCIACGKQIEPGRLEAAPWSAYCLDHQQKLDQAIRPNTY